MVLFDEVKCRRQQQRPKIVEVFFRIEVVKCSNNSQI